MASPISLVLGPFTKGMNTAVSARLLDPSQPQASSGVDYTDGTLRGQYGFGTTAVAGVSTGSRFIHLRDGVTSPWITQNDKNFACLDGTCLAGTVGVSYFTDVASGSPSYVRYAAGNNFPNNRLGVPVPTFTSVTGGAATNRAYRITQVILNADLNCTIESNPSTFTAAQPPLITGTASGCTLNFPAVPADTTSCTNYYYIYATAIGQTTGPMYYIGKAAAGAISFVDTAPCIPPTNPAGDGGVQLLNWDNGGSPQGALYKYDHGSAPALYVLANALLGVPAVPAALSVGTYGGARGGILLGATYSTLRWTQTGYPWYWPALHTEDLDDIIEAIVLGHGVAYVLTRSSVYSVSGYDDTALTITRTAAPHGCLAQGGPAAKMTPYGIVYPCREGVALFDGTTSRVITEGVLASGALASGFINGAYVEGLYLLSTAGSSGGYCLDLNRWPQVNVTQISSSLVGLAYAVVQPHSSGGYTANGLYVLDSNGNIKPWKPRTGAAGSSQLAWTQNTGYLDAGAPTKKKRFMRFWVNGVGSCTYTVGCYNRDGSTAGTITLNGSGWLPASFTGDFLYVAISADSGSAVLDGIEIEAELCA